MSCRLRITISQVFTVVFLVYNSAICVAGFRRPETFIDTTLTPNLCEILIMPTDFMITRRDVATRQQVRGCPTQCDCYYFVARIRQLPSLLIQCNNRTANGTSLAREIDDYLQTAASNITLLEICSTPLARVPESVCRLVQLQALVLLDNEYITRLPDNCFTRLRDLRVIGAILNGLTSLFDNLSKLEAIQLTQNRISFVDPHLFDITANLPKLRLIYLDGNNLTEIDTWPVKRAQLFDQTVVSVVNNSISRFTNWLGWHYDCNSPPLLHTTQFLLWKNEIRHLNALFHGWNITGSFNNNLLIITQ